MSKSDRIISAEDKIFEQIHVIAEEFQLSEAQLLVAINTVAHNMSIRFLLSGGVDWSGET
jgi:hypothetical protein